MSSINNTVSLLYKQIYFRIKIRFYFISWFSGSKTKLYVSLEKIGLQSMLGPGKNCIMLWCEKLRHVWVMGMTLLTEDSRHGYGLEAIRLENDFSFLLILYTPPLVPYNVNINKYNASIFMRNIKTESFLSNLAT